MSAPLPPIVEFREATKRFGEGPLVLDLLNLTVQPGEFVSLLGPSGCGKSTLLRLIAGLTPLTAGSLIVDRRSPDAAAAQSSGGKGLPARRSQGAQRGRGAGA